MSNTDISQTSWSETDASNNSTPPAGWPAGMFPNTVEPTARMMMGAVKRFWDRMNAVYATTGSADAYVVTPTVALVAYATNEIWKTRANFSNTTTTPTINVSALGALTFKKYISGALSALAIGDIQNNGVMEWYSDGTNAILVNPATIGSVPAAAMPALTGDVTTSAGTVATAIAANAVTNSQLAQMPANTIKGNNTGSTANAADIAIAQLAPNLVSTGTWTPADASGAGLTFTGTAGNCDYWKFDTIVVASFALTYPATANSSPAQISGLPFTSKITSTSGIFGGIIGFTDAGSDFTIFVNENAQTFLFFDGAGAGKTNANFSGKTIRATIVYRSAT